MKLEANIINQFNKKMKGSRTKSPFTISYLEQLKLCFIRSYQEFWVIVLTITLMFASVAQAFVAGSLYYNTPDDVSGAFSRGGVIFFAVLFMSLMGLAEISASFSSRPILMKQKLYNVSPSADSLSILSCRFQLVFSSILFRHYLVLLSI